MHRRIVFRSQSTPAVEKDAAKRWAGFVVRTAAVFWLSVSGRVFAWQLETPVPEVPNVEAEEAVEPMTRPNSGSQETLQNFGDSRVLTEPEPWPIDGAVAEPVAPPGDYDEGIVTNSIEQAPIPDEALAGGMLGQMYSTAQPFWYGYSTPVRVSYSEGESYAEPNGFLSVDLFRPLNNWRFSRGSEQLRYLDARVGFATSGGVFGNLGLGHRHYFADEDTIVDANIWYDIDNTGSRVFHQVAGGGQIQNQNLLLRGHYYFPFHTTETITGFTESSAGAFTFVGNGLGLERYRIEEQAFHGFDAEIGLLCPVNDHMLKWFVGYYNFEAENAAPVDGVSTTLSAAFAKNVDVGFQVTYDDESDFGYLMTVSYDFYQGNRDPAQSIRHRLGESVRRNRHILRRKTAIFDPEAATAANGNAINIIHVSSTGNSSGTFESPYATLAQAATDAAATPDSIIFVHADSVLNGQSIVLPAGTRLLGEGGVHTVTTSQQGDITLPRATTGTATPIIRSSPTSGPAITLANNVEVNNIAIENAGATGIFGTGMTGGASVLNTTINGAVTGMHIQNSGGTLTVDNLTISNTTGTGLQLETSTAGAAFTFNNALAINNAGLYGIRLSRNTSTSNTTFAGPVSVTNSGNHGIFFDDNSDSVTTVFNGTTTIDTTGGSGIFLSDIDNGTLATVATPIQFVGDLSINNTTQSGIAANLHDSDISVQNLAITNWDANAISIANSSADFTFGSPLSLNNANGSLASTVAISNSTGAMSFQDVTITDTARTAVGQATVSIIENDTSVRDISFNTLNITANNGVGLLGQDSGTSTTKLVIRGGTISTVGSSAVVLDDIATDITFRSVSATNATVGISLTDLGASTAFHERFQIVGDSFTPGSGGTITGAQTGVLASGAENVSLHFMTINATTTAVRSESTNNNEPEDLTVNQLVLNGGTSPNWIGIDLDWDDGGAHAGDNNQLTNNTIMGTGTSQTGIQITNIRSLPALDATIGGNTISLTGATSNGLSFNSTGTAVGQTSTSGDIDLTAGLNNIINATGAPFIVTESTGGEVTGQIRINGALVSP